MEIKVEDRKLYLKGREGAVSINWGVRLIYKHFYTDFFVRENDLILISKGGNEVPKELPGYTVGNDLEIVPFITVENDERKYFLEKLSQQQINEIAELISEDPMIFFISSNIGIENIEISQDLAIVTVEKMTVSIPFLIGSVEPSFSFPIRIECDGKFSGKITLVFKKALRWSSEFLASEEIYRGKTKTKGISIDIVRMNVSLDEFPTYAVGINSKVLYYGLLVSLEMDFKINDVKKVFNILGPVLVYRSSL